MVWKHMLDANMEKIVHSKALQGNRCCEVLRNGMTRDKFPQVLISCRHRAADGAEKIDKGKVAPRRRQGRTATHVTVKLETLVQLPDHSIPVVDGNNRVEEMK